MRALRLAFIALLPITLSACALIPHQRAAANSLDAQLLEIMRERTRLWKLPKVDGGTREIDISELVCPMVNAENLSELFKVNDENVDHMAGYPPGSQLWAIEGDVTGPLEASTLAVNLGPGERCVVHFRLML